MARVKVCPIPGCGYENAADRMSCRQCRSPLANVALTDSAAVVESSAGSEERTSNGPALGGATSPAGGPKDPRRARLVFDWGEVVITSREPVGIGRDPSFSPQVAEHIPDNVYVSRQHAQVFMRSDGTTWLRHLSTTNPTYVNGRKPSDAENAAHRRGGHRVLAAPESHRPVRVRPGRWRRTQTRRTAVACNNGRPKRSASVSPACELGVGL